jgi:transcription antitermination factor NusG
MMGHKMRRSPTLKGQGPGTRAGTNDVSWYALEVVRQKEYVAGFILKRRFAVETFIPTVTRWRYRHRYARVKSELAFAALPGVIFCGFADTPPWYDVMRAPLVIGVLSSGNGPARVDARELDAYRATQLDGHLVLEPPARAAGGATGRGGRAIRVRGRGILHAPDEQRHMRSRREFAAGEDVRVAEGPLRDTTIRVRAIAGARARVLLPLFGGSKASIAVGALEAAE